MSVEISQLSHRVSGKAQGEKVTDTASCYRMRWSRNGECGNEEVTGFRGVAFTRHGRAEAQGATLASQTRREQSENWKLR